MFSMKQVEKMMAENDRKTSSSKSKKPRKRKRKPSMRESESDGISVVPAEVKRKGKDTSVVLAEVKHNVKENQSDGLTVSNGDGSKLSQSTRPASKKKRPQGIKERPKVLTAHKKNIRKHEKLPSVIKKKKRGKIEEIIDSQVLETNTEGYLVLNGVHDEISSKAKIKNPKPSLSQSPKPDFDSNFDKTNKNKRSKKKFDNASKNGIPVAKSKASKKKLKKSSDKAKIKKVPFYEESSFPEEKHKYTKQEKRDFVFQKKQEAKDLEFSVKKSLISSPVNIFNIGKKTSVVVLFSGQSLYFHGLLSVRPLIGRATILGYTLEELEKRVMYSFNSHALLSVRAEEGCKVDASQHSKRLLQYGLVEEQVQHIIDKQAEAVVVLELQRCNLPIAKRLSVIGQHQLMTPKGSSYKKALWGMLVTKENCQKYYLTEELAEWKELSENICLSLECGNAPRVILCGGKGVGKSTLFRYIVNSLLSKKGTKVQCIDVDPGQPELSLPSCLSLTQVTEPLLGPPYTHHAIASSPNVKQIMIGSVSPQFGLQRYLKAVNELIVLSQKQTDCPLVINTMGWTVGTGIDLILDTIRIVQPTHVIQIQSAAVKNNYDIVLSDHVVQDYVGGILTRPRRTELHYSLTELKSSSGRKDKAVSFTPKLLRELAVMLHLSDIISDFFANAGQAEITHNTVIVPWPKVVLHVCGTKVPKQRILQVLNGNLVALCQVDSRKIESVGPDLPKHLIDDLDFGQCIGWGVIRGVDPVTRELHIFTSVSAENVNCRVNAIIKPELHLPDRFYGFFTEGEGPYYQKMNRSGAARLKVSRQIKSNMPTLQPKHKD